MAGDRLLSRNFTLSEVPHYELYTEDDVARLEETVARVLQPLRNRFGRIQISSGMYWADSGEAREGAHSHAGTVDFVSLDTPLRKVWEHGSTFLIPAGYVGRWIYEPAREADPARGVKAQGEHIHLAPREAMADVFGDRRIQVLEETTEGTYVLRYQLAAAIGSVGALTIAGGVALLLWLRRRDALAVTL